MFFNYYHRLAQRILTRYGSSGAMTDARARTLIGKAMEDGLFADGDLGGKGYDKMMDALFEARGARRR